MIRHVLTAGEYQHRKQSATAVHVPEGNSAPIAETIEVDGRLFSLFNLANARRHIAWEQLYDPAGVSELTPAVEWEAKA